MARPAAGGLRRLLAGAVLALPVIAFLPEDGVSGEPESLPQDVDGVLYWQPGFNERAEQNPSRPSLSDHPHLARLTPPNCGRLRDLLTGDEEDYRWAIEAWDSVLLIPCQLYILRKTARPAAVGGIDMADPVSDILKRLDVSSFRSSFGPALPDRPGPVTLRYFFGAPGANADDILTKRKDGFEYLSRYDGKDTWFRKLSLLAAADWTGDGKAELLVSWEDDNLGGGTYNTYGLMVLGAESRNAPITAMHVEDWLLDHRVDAVEVLE